MTDEPSTPSSRARMRASITATLDEIVAGHDATGVPADPIELDEARAILDRIERRMRSCEPMTVSPKKLADFAES